jgi:hypothetical protein
MRDRFSLNILEFYSWHLPVRADYTQRKPYFDNYGLTRDILEGKRSSYLVEFELRFTGFGVEILTALKVSVIWNRDRFQIEVKGTPCDLGGPQAPSLKNLPGRLAGDRCRPLRNLHHIDLFFIVS